MKQPKPLLLFVQRSAGSGKSFLIKEIKSLIKSFVFAEKSIDATPRPFAGCAVGTPTGCATHNVGGCTVHELFALNVEDNGRSQNKLLLPEKLQNLRESLFNILFLIIDEISMVSENVFLDVHNWLTEICGVKDGDVYFGGKCVILLDDVFQLKPIGSKFIFDDKAKTKYLWDLFHVMF